MGPWACFDYKPEEFEFNWAKNSNAETKEKKFAEHGSRQEKKKTMIEAPIIDSVGFSGVVIYDSCYRVESGACQDKLWQISSKTMPQQINYWEEMNTRSEFRKLITK